MCVAKSDKRCNTLVDKTLFPFILSLCYLSRFVIPLLIESSSTVRPESSPSPLQVRQDPDSQYNLLLEISSEVRDFRTDTDL